MALGATRGAVQADVLVRSVGVLGAGLLAGVVLAGLLTRTLEGSLYGVSPLDPSIFAVAGAVLGVATLLATWLPARRAAAVDPAATLKEE